MNENKLLNISIIDEGVMIILEKIKKYISDPKGFFHIVSLNPENLVLCQEDSEFEKIVETAQIKLVDGMGIVLAGKMTGVKVGERVTGVRLMSELVRLAGESSLTVMLIGGKENLALELSQCYQRLYPDAKFVGLEGIKDIKNPEQDEEEQIFSIVTAVRPRFIFVAFGSPYQEKWLWRNRAYLQGAVCMGVGGAFDYLGGNAKRPFKIIQQLGLEWLFRLVNQPWRWRRQLRLIKFFELVLKQKFFSR
ncbi:MAG: WecB/TagA/CpsF family glycosyltransferase [Candidatus Roizmanbacteria bacterium]|nr:MAG: WecB/TagA/CpsF family glycosyltransferase [Candidatus Roizmanbacteria bacterium]